MDRKDGGLAIFFNLRIIIFLPNTINRKVQMVQNIQLYF
jgi:hypothetical protein